MRTYALLVAIVLLAGMLALTAVACEEEGPSATEVEGVTPRPGVVDVTITEWIVAPFPGSVKAGTVTLNAFNIGGEEHELAIIKTDLAPDALPSKEDGSVDEADAAIELIQRIPKFPPGPEIGSATVDLGPGKYVLICNVVVERNGQVVSHYRQGMRAAFEVTE